MIALLLLLLLTCMLGMLPTVRGWLAEKREAAARGRVFAYRRFLTPKELEQRTRALSDARWRRDALVWLDGIGGIYPPAALCPGRAVSIACINRLGVQWQKLDQDMPGISVEMSDFHKFDVCNFQHPDFRAYALLIDECDSTGLRMLCEALDRKFSRDRHLRNERLWA